jgi:hypothetical protein
MQIVTDGGTFNFVYTSVSGANLAFINDITIGSTVVIKGGLASKDFTELVREMNEMLKAMENAGVINDFGGFGVVTPPSPS